MKYHAKPIPISQWSHFCALVLVCALAAQWFSPVASAETGGSRGAGLSSVSLDRYSPKTIVNSVPQGIARPSQRATMSAPLQGVLVQLHVNSGDIVKKGQILAVIDNRVALAAVEAAEAAAHRTAAIDHSRHALALAHSLLVRHLKLQESQAGSDFELEQVRAQRDQAKATLASAIEEQLQAKRNLALEKARLETHNLRALFDGKVIRIDATVGTTLTPTDQFITIVNRDWLEAEMFLPLELFGKLKEGSFYPLSAFAPINRAVQGQLVFASPAIDPATRTFRCQFKIDNRDRKLPTGFGVRYNSSH